MSTESVPEFAPESPPPPHPKSSMRIIPENMAQKTLFFINGLP
jgi:hypothetical protein